MTPAELRILVSVRAADAKKMLGQLTAAMNAIKAKTAEASASIRGFNGTLASSNGAISNTSKNAADLAANLSRVGKSASGVTKVSASAKSANAALAGLEKNSMKAAQNLAAIDKAATRAAAGISRISKSAPEIKALGAAFKGTAADIAAFNAALNKAATAGTRAEKTVGAAGAAAKASGTAAAGAAKGWESMAAAQAASATSARAAATANKAAAAATSTNAASTAAASAAQLTLAERVAKSSEEMRKAGSRAQWAGRQISLMFTAPTALLIGAGTKWILDLQKQQTQLAKVYGDTHESAAKLEKQLNSLQGQFREMSDAYGFSQEEITGIGAAWAQAGKSGQALAEYTRLSTEAMIIGDITAQQAQESMVGLNLQWGLAAKQSKITATEMMSMQDAIAAINTASNQTQVSYADLLTVMSQAGSVAKNAGVSFKETLAMATSITRITGSANKAGNALKSIFTNAMFPTRGRGTDFLKQLGVDLENTEDRALTASQRIERVALNMARLDEQGRITAAAGIFTKWQVNAFAQLGNDIDRARVQLNLWTREITGTEVAGKNLYESLSRLDSIKPGSNAEKAMRALKIEIDDAGYKTMNVNAKFIRFADSLRGLNDEQRRSRIGDIFGETRVSQIDELVKKTNENTEALGNYNRELATLGDKRKNFDSYKKELNTFLESNPQKFKIAGQMIKNSIMDVVIVLLPYIIATAQAIAQMARAFSEMNPTLQKVVIGFMIFLALVGPLAILISSFKVLFGVIGGGMAKLLGFFIVTSKGADGASKSYFRFSAAGKKAAAENRASMTSMTGIIRSGFASIIRSAFNSAASYVRAAFRGAKGSTQAYAQGATATARAVWVSSVQVVNNEAATGARRAQIALNTGRTLLQIENNTGMLRRNAAGAVNFAIVEGEVISGAQRTANQSKTGKQMLALESADGRARRLANQRVNFEIVSTEQVANAKRVANQTRNNGQMLALESASGRQRRMAQTAYAAGVLREDSVTAARRLAIINANNPRLAAAQAAGMQAQARAVAAGGASVVAAQAAVSRKQALVATTGGVTAGAGAANGAKKGFKGKAGGLLTTMLSVFSFLPIGWMKAIGRGFSAIPKAISSGVKSIGPKIGGLFYKLGINSGKTFGQGVMRVLGGKGGWIGAAIGAIVAGVAFAWDDIVKSFNRIFKSDNNIPIFARPFVFSAELIIAVVKKLPDVVVAVFKAVVSTIVAAGKAVYKAFSYLNPFQRHSPSLVENVTNGMAVVTSVFADSSKQIQGDIHDAYRAILKFGTATAGLSGKAAGIKRDEDLGELNKADPSGAAANAYKGMEAQTKKLEANSVKLNAAMVRQQKIVDGLKQKLDAADKAIAKVQRSMDQAQKVADAFGKALEFAQSRLDFYANAPIKGMRAMSDAIFENEMAQKRLQLQMMQLEEAGGSIDDITDKYARLQGQIETLSGERAELQQKGAGSDILATYDKMIADLKKQQGEALTGPAAEVEALNKSLDELKRKGEMLDLQNSLQFDPLTRQIQQLVSNEQELDFGTIVAGVQTYKAQVDGLTVAHQTANDVVAAHASVLSVMSDQREALAATYDAEQEKLDGIKTTYDQNRAAIDALESAMNELVSNASTVNQYMDEQKRKMEEAAEKLKNAKDGVDDLKNSLGELGDLDIDPDSLVPEDIGPKLEEKFGDMFKGLGDKFKNFFKELGPKILGWVTGLGKWLLDGLKKLPGEIAKGLSFILGYLIGALAKIASKIGEGFEKGLVWIFTEMPGKIWEWITNIDWSQVWQAISDVFFGIFTNRDDFWGKIGNWIVEGLLGGIWNAIQNIGQWIMDNIITPFMNGIKEGWGIASPSTVMAEIGMWLIEGFLGGLVDNFFKLVTWFTELPGKLIAAMGDLGKWIGDKVSQALAWVRDKLPEWAQGVFDFFKNLPSNIIEKLGDLKKWIGDKFHEALDWLRDKLPSWADPILNFFENLPNLIGKALDTIKEKAKTPINFVIGTVYNNGIRRIWNNTAGKVGLPEMAEVQQLAKGGNVAGRVVGPGTGTSDSIFTSAAPGTEIFTAREVANAGGFAGLERLLSRRGVRGFAAPSGTGAPVALSNGEFAATPAMVAQLGGTNAVKAIRAQLAGGGIPQHGLGDMVNAVTSLPGKAVDKVVDTGRGLAGEGVDALMSALEKTIPDVLTPPGGDIGRLPKGFFNAVRVKVVDTIKGHAGGGTVARFAGGGTTASASPAAGGAATGASAGAAGAGSGGVDLGTGTGLAQAVAGSTDAAAQIWEAYYQEIETAQVASNTIMQTQQLMADTIMLAQQTASITGMTVNADTYRATEGTNSLLFQQTQATNDLAHKAVLNSQLSTFTSAQGSTWGSFRSNLDKITTDMQADVTTNFNELGANIEEVVMRQITPTIETFDPLLNTAIGWFGSASDDIGQMWAQTLPKVQDPTRSIINDVYNNGVRVAWSKVHTWLDLPELEQFTAGFAEGGAPGFGGNMVPLSSLSNPNNPRSVKNGGPLKAASGSRDSTLFAGMRGEYVMSKKMVEGAGGIGNLEAWRKAVNTGVRPVETGGTINFDAVPGFAAGGLVARPENQEVPGVIQQVPEILKPYYNRVYDYGGGGEGGRGYDCSGWTGAVHQILNGASHVGRIWSTEVNFSSFGYKRGNDGYWSMGVHNGGGGMNSHTAGTLAGVNYESGGAHNTSTWGGPAAGTINSQFENQYYLPSLGGKFIGTPGGNGMSVAITPMLLEMWDKHMDTIKPGIEGLGLGGTIGKNPMAAFDKFNLLRGVVEKKGEEKDAAAAVAAAANYGQGAPGSYGGGVERWRSVVQEALQMVGQPKSYDEITLRRMNQESGGDPQAINLWDSNAAAGTPSKGLMQVIDPTFQANRHPALPNNIWDPMANIVASMRYTLGRYGSLPAGYNRAGGYDKGGWLEPGITQAINLTGKREAVLTNTDWKAVYKAAMKPAVDAKMIAEGYIAAMEKVYGINISKKVGDVQAQAVEWALEGQNATWNPQIIQAAEDTSNAVQSTTQAVNGTTGAVYKSTDTLKGMLKQSEEQTAQLKALTELMTALSSSSAGGISVDENGNVKASFGAFAPAMTALAGLITMLPDAEPTYVSWAGTNAEVSDEMRREKLLNDISNSSKGLYYAFKTTAPPVLKHTAIIGTALESLMAQDSAAWSSALAAIAQNNPAGYFVAVILVLKSILVMLPLIINAILDIGPAIIQSLIAYFTKFEPDAVYAYGSYEAANDAVIKNQTAIRNGATGPNFETTTVQQEQQSYNFNFYGDVVVPNVTNESGVDKFVNNLLGLAGA
ncbi:tail length tape measure protein [Gordonia phage GordDuk1]|uniref:Tape measure protein n=1 Tax=Gordonia phage GordDuk1 TaxID=1622191 RepID=A0A0E3T6Q7_9CAUD|nr:tail length tape measure protein [Gordonia phage GordDuk1]AKC02944.1 tape measure protein [Gordonia phage GordDuk1]